MKKLLCFILVCLLSITSVGCGNDIKQKEIQDSKHLENEAVVEKSQNVVEGNYEKYIDMAFESGLINEEFSKGNYPDEGFFLLELIDYEKLKTFKTDYDNFEWLYYKAEDVEKDIMSKLDITVEEIRENIKYIEDIDAYPQPAGGGGAGAWAITKDVEEKSGMYKIHYEVWSVGINCDGEELEYTGILTVSKDGKFLSNSDINYVNKDYGKLYCDREDFREYRKYIEIVSNAGLLYREFSKGNYPTENLHLLYVVDNEKLDEFECTFNDSDWTLHNAEDVEADLMKKFDITIEELRTKLEYIEDKNAYPKCINGSGVGCWTNIKNVIEKDDTCEIYYEDWSICFNHQPYGKGKELDFSGKLIITKDGKILSNSDLKYYSESYKEEFK